VRSERARLKREIRAGEADLTMLLATPPECARSATVAEILLAVPGIGKAGLRRILTSCRIHPGARLAALSERQRGELVEATLIRGKNRSGSEERGGMKNATGGCARCPPRT
jgi:hypothetical protein